MWMTRGGCRVWWRRGCCFCFSAKYFNICLQILNRNRAQIRLWILRHHGAHVSHQRTFPPGSFLPIYGSIRQIDDSLNHFELALYPTAPAKEPAVNLKDSVVPLPLAVKTLTWREQQLRWAAIKKKSKHSNRQNPPPQWTWNSKRRRSAFASGKCWQFGQECGTMLGL